MGWFDWLWAKPQPTPEQRLQKAAQELEVHRKKLQFQAGEVQQLEQDCRTLETRIKSSVETSQDRKRDLARQLLQKAGALEQQRLVLEEIKQTFEVFQKTVLSFKSELQSADHTNLKYSVATDLAQLQINLAQTKEQLAIQQEGQNVRLAEAIGQATVANYSSSGDYEKALEETAIDAKLKELQ